MMGTLLGISLTLVGLLALGWATRRVWRGMVTVPTRSPSARSLRQNAAVAEAYDQDHPRITKVVVTRQRHYRRPHQDEVES